MKPKTTLCYPTPCEWHWPQFHPPKNAPGSFSSPVAPGSCLFVVILGRPLEIVLEGAGQLVEQPHLLAVLQEPRRGRRLIWLGQNTEERVKKEAAKFTFNTPILSGGL